MSERKPISPLLTSTAISLGLWAFALLYRGTLAMQVMAFIVLSATALMMVLVLIKNDQVLLQKSLLQWHFASAKILVYSIIISISLALWYRYIEEMPLFPLSFKWFVILSILIGATEEIIFRGVVQGEANRWNTTGAVYLSALAFAGYKALLFILPAAENETNVFNLFTFTFLAGILLGYARKNSGSLWPCLIAHGIFDLLVYMETAKPPWWVW